MFRVAPLAALLASACLSGSAFASMPRREPPLMLGGARPRIVREIPLDPGLPTGARIPAAKRPPSAKPLCSLEYPVCVQRGNASERAALGALEALERAYARLEFGLALPAPLPDAGLGGSDALDAYLTEPGDALEVDADPPTPGVFSQSSGFCRLPLLEGALLERAATLCLGEAIALGLDASETPHLRRAFATWLWWASGLPTALDVEALDDVQAHPELAIAARELSFTSEGDALFFEYLESVRSAAAPGELVAALFSAAVSPSRPITLAYQDAPDLFDVLRHSLDEEPDRFAALMVDFAAARAFVGDRSDGMHLPALGWAGAFGRVRFDWNIKFSSLPRRVLVDPPLESTGCVLIWVSLDGVAIGASLGLEVQWEPPVSFQWQIVRVDAEGSEISRVDVPFQERGHSAQARVTNFEGARALIIVGTNLEGVDLSHPFDPDVSPSEPHAATVYLVAM